MKTAPKKYVRKVKRKPNSKRRWIRYSPEDRLEMILSEAVNFFAEHGFEAQTRDLAKRIGVSQGLIYRYFHTKEELIDKVYQRLYMSRWNIYWEELLSDRRLTLEHRLKTFYKSYLSTFDDYAWMRISVYSGLRGNNLVQRYLRIIFERVIQVIAVELRHQCGLPSVHPSEIPKLDLELTWNLHATVIYFLMRRYVFQVEPTGDNDAVAEQAVDQVLIGSLRVLQQRYPSPSSAMPPESALALAKTVG
jgi:AcrR family transcriptional regulator